MVSIASKVGPSRSSQRPTVMNLKLAVSRYDFVTVGPIAGREVLVSFEDQLGSVIDYEDVPHEDLVYIFRAVDTLRKRSEEHTSELQSRGHLVCRLLLEKKKHEATKKARKES